MLQTASDIQQNQWSSTETELSDVDENSSDMDVFVLKFYYSVMYYGYHILG